MLALARRHPGWSAPGAKVALVPQALFSENRLSAEVPFGAHRDQFFFQARRNTLLILSRAHRNGRKFCLRAPLSAPERRCTISITFSLVRFFSSRWRLIAMQSACRASSPRTRQTKRQVDHIWRQLSSAPPATAANIAKDHHHQQTLLRPNSRSAGRPPSLRRAIRKTSRCRTRTRQSKRRLRRLRARWRPAAKPFGWRQLLS